MTYEEFKQYIGCEVNTQQYAAAHAIFMRSKLDAKDFCELWKTDEGVREIAAALSHEVDAYKDEVANLKDIAYTAGRRLLEMRSKETDELALMLMEKDEYLLYKLQEGCPLRDKDREMLFQVVEAKRKGGFHG